MNTSSVTRFFPIGTHFTANVGTTEASFQMINRTAADYSRIGVRISNATSGGSGTLKLRKDTGGGGADGNNTASITANTAGWYQDAVPHTDTVAVGDKTCMAITSGAGLTTGFQIQTMSVKLTPSSGGVMYYGWFARGDTAASLALRLGAASQNYEITMGGGSHSSAGSDTANTVAWRTKMRRPGVIDHVHTRCILNTSAAAITLRLRISNANGNSVATITAGTTGTFEDVTNTDAVVAADVDNWRYTTGAGGVAADFTNIFARFVPTTSGHDIFTGKSDANADGSGSTVATNYYNCWGFASRNTTELSVRTLLPAAMTASFWRAYVATAQVGAITGNLYKNGSTANQTISFTSATTGIFEDTTNSDSLADGDGITYGHGAMVSVNGFYIRWFGMVLDPGVVVTPGATSQTHRYNSVILG